MDSGHILLARLLIDGIHLDFENMTPFLRRLYSFGKGRIWHISFQVECFWRNLSALI